MKIKRLSLDDRKKLKEAWDSLPESIRFALTKLPWAVARVGCAKMRVTGEAADLLEKASREIQDVIDIIKNDKAFDNYNKVRNEVGIEVEI